MSYDCAGMFQGLCESGRRSAGLGVAELSLVTYGDSKAQCLLTDCARGPLHRFGDFDHRRLALRVCLEIANVFLRPGNTLSSFDSHQIILV
jgi:hypothetical protein